MHLNSLLPPVFKRRSFKRIIPLFITAIVLGLANVFGFCSPVFNGLILQPKCPQWKPFSLNAIHDVTCHELDLESGQFGDPFAASVFKVSQCMSRWHCGQGYFLVQRRDEELCKRMLRKDGKMRKVIFDDELNRKLVEDVGPDFFYLVFDGPARVAPMTWTHARNCKTRHPFHLVNPGNYTVSLEWTHTNFSAVNEVDLKGIHPSPVDKGRDVLRNMKLEVCPQCPQLWPSLVRHYSRNSPICSRTRPIQGVFLSAEGDSGASASDTLRANRTQFPYIWIPLGCRLDQTFDQHQNDACFGLKSSRSYLMVGDSHSHRFWDAVDRRIVATTEPYIFGEKTIWYNHYQGHVANTYHASGNNSLFLERIRTDDGIPTSKLWPDNRTTTRQNVTFEYQWSHQLTEITDDQVFQNDGFATRFGRQNIVVLQTGAWAASTLDRDGQWTFNEYRLHIQTLAEKLLEMRRKDPMGPTFVWASATSMKIQRQGEDTAYEKSGDWRNPYRMKLFRDVAKEVMEEAGIPYLDWFDVTNHFIRESPDGSHFTNLPATDAVVDDLLHKLNVCAKEE